MTKHELVPLQEAARMLSVKAATLRKWDREGKLKPIRIGSRGDRRYRRADLLTFLARAEQTSLGHQQELYKQGAPVIPWLCAPWWMISWVRNIHNSDMEHISFLYIYFKGDIIEVYSPKADFNRVARKVYHLPPTTIDDWYQHFLLACQRLEALAQQFYGRDWQKVTNEQLLLYHQQLKTIYEYFWDYSLFVDAFDAGFDQEKITDLARRHNATQAEIITLTSIPNLTYSQEYQLALLKLAGQSQIKALTEEKFKDFVRRFDWIHSSYAGVKHLDQTEIHSEVEKLTQEPDLPERIKELEGFADRQVAKENKILADHELIENPLKFFQQLTYWREVRKKFNTMGFNALDKIGRELARRTKFSIEAIEYLGHDELIPLLAGQIDEASLLARRTGGLMYIFAPNRPVLTLEGEEATSVHHDLETTLLTQEAQDILQGVVASQGYARGTARLVLTLDDFTKVEDGDILVTVMTRPEFLPIMKKVAAIVTDEGGITCHAAIVAREMKKPCIIGTQVATKRIPDGAVVEVRAHHGTVRIIQ